MYIFLHFLSMSLQDIIDYVGLAREKWNEGQIAESSW